MVKHIGRIIQSEDTYPKNKVSVISVMWFIESLPCKPNRAQDRPCAGVSAQQQDLILQYVIKKLLSKKLSQNCLDVVILGNQKESKLLLWVCARCIRSKHLAPANTPRYPGERNHPGTGFWQWVTPAHFANLYVQQSYNLKWALRYPHKCWEIMVK